MYRQTTRVPDVPYGDHYTQNETWTVVSSSNTATQCILRASGCLVFSKPTVFESKISGRSQEEMIDNFKKWQEAIKERGYMVKIEQPIKIPIRQDMRSRVDIKHQRELRS